MRILECCMCEMKNFVHRHVFFLGIFELLVCLSFVKLFFFCLFFFLDNVDDLWSFALYVALGNVR